MTVSRSNQTRCLPAPGIIRQDTNIVVHKVEIHVERNMRCVQLDTVRLPTVLLQLARKMPWLVDVGIPDALTHGDIESTKLCDGWTGVHLCAYDAFDGLDERDIS